MNNTTRDLASVVSELRAYCARIMEPNNDALTSIQKQAAQEELARETRRVGVAFGWSYNDGNPKLNFTWSSPLYVSGTGVISDVAALGHFPIRLSLGDSVFISLEPRNLGTLDHHERCRLNNSEYANLRKGSNYEFRGMTRGCSFYGKQAQSGRFEFSIEGDSDSGAGEGVLGRFFGGFFK